MTWILIANLVVMSAAFVQTATGLGFAMIAVPLLVLIDFSYVPGPILFVSLILAVMMTVSGWWHIEFREFHNLLPGLILGTLAGAMILQSVSAASLSLLFGVTLVFAVLMSFRRWKVALSPVTLFSGGFASGLMGTVSAIHGPPLVVIYSQQPVAKIRATLALIFLAGYALSLLTLHFIGKFGWQELWTAIYLIPGVIAGFALALLSRSRIPVALIRASILILAAISGLLLIQRSLI